MASAFGELRSMVEEDLDPADVGAGVGHIPQDEVRLRVNGMHSHGHASTSFGSSSSTSSSLCDRPAHINKEALTQAGQVDESANLQMQQDSSIHKFWHRAGWLVMLLMFQSTSSIILEHFELLIQHHPVVIYFLTMLVGAGGNAGSQSTVLVVRRLALAAVHSPKEAGDIRLSVRRIVGSEVSVGVRLALVLFVACVLRCIIFKVRGKEMLAICLSMFCIVFTSTLLGAALPVLLSRAKVDPAHASAAIQVIMDISGVSVTCVVSCLVLGMPINADKSAAQLVTTTTTHMAAAVGGAAVSPATVGSTPWPPDSWLHPTVAPNLESFGTGIRHSIQSVRTLGHHP
eukprot:TRINITY_DN13539_c0_g1_i1.p1 TRINITY_DN13539_c0_g1~~TRINITY_DN13539_c0_g1_i1.p1  ORF type:complete len:364 (+),score=58.82 TRINITY_DN13539_c0_g1_i1:63-1094(+)